MKKWMITLIGLTFTLAVAGIVTGFTLNTGSGEPAQDPDATSIDDIDPKVCNAIHDINACTPEELEDLGVAPHGDSTYDEWLSDFGDGKVVTSIDNVDPNACALYPQYQRLHPRGARRTGKPSSDILDS